MEVAPPVDDLLNLDLVQQSSGQQNHEVVVLGLDAPQVGVQKFEAWKKMAYVCNFGFATLTNVLQEVRADQR